MPDPAAAPTRARGVWRAALLAALLPVSAGWALLPQRQADLDIGDPVHGQRLFASKGCVRCHAIRGAGGRIGPDLGRGGIKGSFYEIASVMWNHSEHMSAKMREYHLTRPQFEDDELSDLIAFLYFLNYFDEPGDPRAGRALFIEKYCIRCHSVGGEGGAVGPALDTIPRGIAPLRIAQALWNHGPAMRLAMEAEGLQLPVFAGTEIIDLFAFLRSQGARRVNREFQSAGDPVRGQTLFESKGCSLCHGVFSAEESAGPDLGRVELHGSVTQIAGRMWNHWPAMAQSMENLGVPVPVFEGDDLADIFAFIYIVRYNRQTGDYARGREVFETSGCSVCHGMDGSGLAGPDLRQVVVGRPKEEIAQRMWNHAPKMSGKMGEENLFWPRLSGPELADLLLFLSTGWDASGEMPARD